jgi:hypothetical protein
LDRLPNSPLRQPAKRGDPRSPWCHVSNRSPGGDGDATNGAGASNDGELANNDGGDGADAS